MKIPTHILNPKEADPPAFFGAEIGAVIGGCRLIARVSVFFIAEVYELTVEFLAAPASKTSWLPEPRSEPFNGGRDALPPLKKSSVSRDTIALTRRRVQYRSEDRKNKIKETLVCTDGIGELASEPFISGQSNAYLAINWQRVETSLQVTSREQRFTTPQSTINDVCDLERSALSCRSCNRRRLHLKLSGPARGKGGGGSRDAKAETVVRVQSRGIFGAKGADTVFLFKKNSARNGGRSTKAAAQQFCWACAMSSQHHHEHQSLN
jgi:hypothetical protein